MEKFIMNTPFPQFMYQTSNQAYSVAQQSNYIPVLGGLVLMGLGAGLAMMLNGCSHGGGHKATHHTAHKDLESHL